ncbi:hypothetical protein [Bacillus sp. P14.5]|uniref:hypothetical protein n=1 Tax=Bacillus sp. P14.5 TaxID=1983400 RepID=UPI000DE8F903|nr:hypothetical protein [Bacillus sp. P14.5]
MVKNKLALISSAVIFCFCMFLFFPFPNNQMLEARTTFMSFPITEADGYNPLAIVGSVLFIVAMVLLVKGLEKFRFRAVVITAFVYTVMPLLLVIVYQETFARGIDAISYYGNGTCDFESESEETMNGECKLNLHNRSGRPVTFEIEFLDSFYMKKDIRLVSLMNVNGPYSITLQPNSKEIIQLEELLDVSHIENRVGGGSSMDVHFKISDGKKTRIL